MCCYIECVSQKWLEVAIRFGFLDFWPNKEPNQCPIMLKTNRFGSRLQTCERRRVARCVGCDRRWIENSVRFREAVGGERRRRDGDGELLVRMDRNNWLHKNEELLGRLGFWVQYIHNFGRPVFYLFLKDKRTKFQTESVRRFVGLLVFFVAPLSKVSFKLNFGGYFSLTTTKLFTLNIFLNYFYNIRVNKKYINITEIICKEITRVHLHSLSFTLGCSLIQIVNMVTLARMSESSYVNSIL